MKTVEVDEAELARWLAGRPQVIRDMAATHPPNLLYRLRTTGHRVTLCSYSEDGTVTVAVSGKYNAVAFERRVFGILLADLKECDLPGLDDPVGVVLSDDELSAAIATGSTADERHAAVERAVAKKLGRPGKP